MQEQEDPTDAKAREIALALFNKFDSDKNGLLDKEEAKGIFIEIL